MKCVTRLVIAVAALIICSCSHQTDEKIAGEKINFHLFPWRENDFGRAGISVAAQDLKIFELDSARMDIVTHITGRKAGI